MLGNIKNTNEELLDELQKNKEYLNILENNKKELSKKILNLKETYKNNIFSNNYRKKQTSSLNDILNSVENTTILENSSIFEVRNIKNLTLDWGPLNEVTDYECSFISSKFNSYLNNFHQFWKNHFKINSQNKYNKTLDEHIQITKKIQEVKPYLMNKKIKKYLKSEKEFSKEIIEINNLLKLSKNLGSQIKKSTGETSFINEINNLKTKFNKHLNNILNKKIEYLKTCNTEFKTELSKELLESKLSVTNKEIFDSAKNSEEYKTNKKLKYDSYLKTNKKAKNLYEILSIIPEKILEEEGQKIVKKISEINPNLTELPYYSGIIYLNNSLNSKSLKEKESSLDKAFTEFLNFKTNLSSDPHINSNAYSLLGLIKNIKNKPIEEIFKEIASANKERITNLSKFVEIKTLRREYEENDPSNTKLVKITNLIKKINPLEIKILPTEKVSKDLKQIELISLIQTKNQKNLEIAKEKLQEQLNKNKKDVILNNLNTLLKFTTKNKHYEKNIKNTIRLCEKEISDKKTLEEKEKTFEKYRAIYEDSISLTSKPKEEIKIKKLIKNHDNKKFPKTKRIKNILRH